MLRHLIKVRSGTQGQKQIVSTGLSIQYVTNLHILASKCSATFSMTHIRVVTQNIQGVKTITRAKVHTDNALATKLLLARDIVDTSFPSRGIPSNEISVGKDETHIVYYIYHLRASAHFHVFISSKKMLKRVPRE